MGYVLRDIANVIEPARLSLAGLPNFMQLSSKTAGGTRYEARINPTAPNAITLSIQDSEGGTRVITGTTVAGDVSGLVFFISTDALETAENLKAALLNDSYIRANYEVYSDISFPAAVNGVIIRAIDTGAEFNLTIAPTGATVTAISTGTTADTLRGNNAIVPISVDLYRENAAQTVHTSVPAGRLGEFIVTLDKSYNGRAIWFDLNGVAAQRVTFTPPAIENVWFNPGTLTAYRALVRRGGVSNTPFFISEILYSLGGYGMIGESLDIAEYVYTGAPVKTLTEKPITPHRVGQKAFITFMLGAELAGKQISVFLRAYNGRGTFLGSLVKATTATSALGAINTCAFDFDELITSYPTAVRLSAALIMNGSLISEEQVYDVRPECLHELNEFYFINRLGGWDCFNFDGSVVEDVKPASETFNRSVTPDYSAAVGVEGVQTANLEKTITVTGAPINDEIAEWLKQLVASKVVLDGEGRRIIIEDFTLREENNDNTAPVIKYRTSETYTNGY